FVLSLSGDSRIYVPPRPFELDAGTIAALLVIGITILGASAFFIRSSWIRSARPQLILLMSPSGLALAKHDLGKISEDESIIAGFITAINSFSNSLLNLQSRTRGSRSIEEIRHSEFILLLRPLAHHILVLVVLRSNPLVKRRLAKMVIQVEARVRNIGTGDEVNPVESNAYSGVLPDLVEKYLSDLIN
ncbi:MAG TPA: hypothetical protein VJ044_19760, partial [Candidatus Hodarchaeales archaeon]|nr:hypothetical protein [Candidatus Hodarchaeales archaeon]